MNESIKAGFTFGNSNLFEDDVPSANIALRTDDTLPVSLRDIQLNALIQLVHGTHALTLSDRAVILDVQADSTCSLNFACSLENHSALILKTLSIDFSKPLKINNIFTTLDEVSILLADKKNLPAKPNVEDNKPSPLNIFTTKLKRGAAKAGGFFEKGAANIKKTDFFKNAGDFWKENATPYFNKIADTKGWKKITEVAEKTSEKAVELSPVALEKSREILNKMLEFSEETLDRTLDVSVTKIEISSEPASDKAVNSRLNLRFTGEIVLTEKVRIPMNSLQLPAWCMTRFDAELTKLLAQFCVTSSQGTSLSKTFFGMINSLNGNVNSEFDFSPFALELMSRGDRSCRLDIKTDRNCRFNAAYQIKRDENNLVLQANASITHDETRTLKFKFDTQTTDEALIALGAKLDQPDWCISLIGNASDVRGTITLEDGSTIYPNALYVTTHDPRLKDDLQLPLDLTPMPVIGSICFGISAKEQALCLGQIDLKAHGSLAWKTEIPLELSTAHTTFSKFNGDFDLDILKEENGRLSAKLNCTAAFDLTSQMHMTPIPELKLLQPMMTLNANGNIHASMAASMETENVESLVCSIEPSALNIALNQFSIQRDNFEIFSQSPIDLKIEVEKASLSADGIGETQVVLAWQSPVSPNLRVSKKTTPLFTDFPGEGHIRVYASEQGMLHFYDGCGFFDEHFFNALFYPEHEKEKLVSILSHKPLLQNIESFVLALSEVTGPAPMRFIERVKRWYARCRELGITLDLNHAVSMPWFAKMISLFLFDNLDEVPQLQPILEDIVQTRGFDVYKLMSIISRAFPNHDIAHLAPAFRVLEKALTGLPFHMPAPTNNEPCSETESSILLLPSANHLYDLNITTPEERYALYGDNAPLLIDSKTTRARIFHYAAGFTIRQLEWLIANHTQDFTTEQCAKLRHLVAIKKRILKQEPREGSFIIQDFNIDYFLQSILDAEEKLLPTISDISELRDPSIYNIESNPLVECFTTWVTPEDIGRLLSAGIASRLTSQLVQLNQSRLLEYLVKRGKTFARAAFYEAGAYSDRILTSMLMSFLAEDQTLLSTPVDRVKVLSDLLELDIPRRSDYMPGGSKASESYIEKLYEVAHAINGFTAYDAAKLRMRSERTATATSLKNAQNNPKLPPHIERQPDKDDIAEIVRGLEKADALGKKCVDAIHNGSYNELDAKAAQKAYAYAWRVAAAVLAKYPDAFQNTDFKKFYARTYEALLIQTLDDDLINNIDHVRQWFNARSGIPQDTIAQLSRIERRNAIIDVLFNRDADREARRRDPLSWLDTRPAPGNINLKVLFAPGVITEGQKGHELSNAVQRLKNERDIDFIRSNTGNIKSLAFNAEILEQDIRNIDGPFMLLGYSQGCANMMRAESNLMASTPEDRAKLNNLVARHFLFSALNGSPHATAGVEILRNTLIGVEKVLKSYSAITSTPFTEFIFDLIRKTLDAPIITMSLNSVESLSIDGLEQLSRDGQYTPSVISTEVQGVADVCIPEVLYYMTSHFYDQTRSDALPNGTPNDSQVGIDAAHGYFPFNRNDSVDILRRESIPSCTLNAHHWFPLYEEVQFIETPLDVQNAVYHAPKDTMLFPAIETLILFGRAKRK